MKNFIVGNGPRASQAPGLSEPASNPEKGEESLAQLCLLNREQRETRALEGSMGRKCIVEIESNLSEKAEDLAQEIVMEEHADESPQFGKLTFEGGRGVFEGIHHGNHFIDGIYTLSCSDGGQMQIIWKGEREIGEVYERPDGVLYAGESENIGKISCGISIEVNGRAYVGSKTSDQKINEIYQNGVWMESLSNPCRKTIIWANGKPVSEVSYLTENILYEGECPQGDQIHYGKMTWLDQERAYTGTFRKYVLEGVGLYECPKFRYVGHCERQRCQGEGRVVYSEGDFATFHGQFEQGKINGYGEMVYRTGKIYRGFWKKGRKHGMGTNYYPDGTQLSGRWKNGSFLYPNPEEIATQSSDEVAFSD